MSLSDNTKAISVWVLFYRYIYPSVYQGLLDDLLSFEIQLQGRKRMKIKDFLNGYKLNISAK